MWIGCMLCRDSSRVNQTHQAFKDCRHRQVRSEYENHDNTFSRITHTFRVSWLLPSIVSY